MDVLGFVGRYQVVMGIQGKSGWQGNSSVALLFAEACSRELCCAPLSTELRRIKYDSGGS
jgi:hypothetical protein